MLELEAAIAEGPALDEGSRADGDWLLEQGEPRCKLIALERALAEQPARPLGAELRAQRRQDLLRPRGIELAIVDAYLLFRDQLPLLIGNQIDRLEIHTPVGRSIPIGNTSPVRVECGH